PVLARLPAPRRTADVEPTAMQAVGGRRFRAAPPAPPGARRPLLPGWGRTHRLHQRPELQRALFRSQVQMQSTHLGGGIMRPAMVLTYVNSPVNMRLVRVARDQWDVLAILDGRGDCQVLDFLYQLPPNYAAAQRWMIQFLHLQLPVAGPPRKNADLCKSLG